ncbi:multiple sugar transport system permease protein [Actinoplanes xinjiangensis]|uniref:Multiple sugar transport system permease protein n=1 Tax=Actinoplanes xinjiangensis TaxID=512350 RepID=A0A316EUV3_9ACTN|nr:ABC transporter permease subunit [Actinoplanes xinjiangensis]PWK35887.1 multiple sugar transport system permease protein [Actinoplanes xinjiangensis]GIF43070.1 sugar ABC transporter permease [Actinoplanes xinjiangensis]
MRSVRTAPPPVTRDSPPPGPGSLTPVQRRLGRDWRLAALFLTPTAVLVGALVLVPIIQSMITSTTERHGADSVFVGLANYRSLAGDGQFRTGVVNSFVFTAYAEVFKVVLGLAAALLLHRLRRGRALLTGLLLVPWVVPTVVTAFSWRALLDPIFGSVNTLLTDSGIGPLLASVHLIDAWPAGWLSDPSLAMPSVILVNVWKGVPFFTVCFLAGLKSIPAEQYEAATIDGASPLQQFTHVTLPGLRHVITVTVTLSSIWTFNNFDLIWLLTQGGPGEVTAPYVLVAYSKAILQLQYGAGAAVTLVMLPIIAGLVFVLVRLLREDRIPRVPRTALKPLPWIVTAVVTGLLFWASPEIFWKAAVVLAVILLIAAAVGRVVAALGASGGRRASSIVSGIGSGVALAGLLAFVLGPMYWIFVTAFKSETQVVMRDNDLWPTPWTLEQFGALFTNQPFGRWYVNTIMVSAASTVVALLCAALAGYALARLRFRGAQGFTVTVLLTYVMPGALLFIPLYQLLIGARLTDSLWSLVVTYPTFTLPFATWLLTGYFASIPIDLEEAALVDGSTRVQAFRRVVLPLAKPGLLAVALFTLTNAWNEFLFAFVFITKDEYKTLPVGMQSMIAGDVVPQGQLAAASLLVSIPVVIMYAFGQRFLTEGLTAGAVKG